MSDFYYSPHYRDDVYEYRHVIIPKNMVAQLPRDRLMTEEEWRDLGVKQSMGWVHYLIHTPERHVLLFRRPLKQENDENKPLQ